MQLHFLSPSISPLFPNIFIFFETRTQYKVTGKKSKKSDISKGVYDTVKKRLFWALNKNLKINKFPQKCQFLIFFNANFKFFLYLLGPNKYFYHKSSFPFKYWHFVYTFQLIIRDGLFFNLTHLNREPQC